MFYLSSICCACFKIPKKLRNLNDTDFDNVQLLEKFKYCSYGIESVEPQIPLFICLKCCQGLNAAYKFKKSCAENMERFKNYIAKLTANLLKDTQDSDCILPVSENDSDRKLHVNLPNVNNIKVEDNAVFYCDKLTSGCQNLYSDIRVIVPNTTNAEFINQTYKTINSRSIKSFKAKSNSVFKSKHLSNIQVKHNSVKLNRNSSEIINLNPTTVSDTKTTQNESDSTNINFSICSAELVKNKSRSISRQTIVEQKKQLTTKNDKSPSKGSNKMIVTSPKTIKTNDTGSKTTSSQNKNSPTCSNESIQSEVKIESETSVIKNETTSDNILQTAFVSGHNNLLNETKLLAESIEALEDLSVYLTEMVKEEKDVISTEYDNIPMKFDGMDNEDTTYSGSINDASNDSFRMSTCDRDTEIKYENDVSSMEFKDHAIKFEELNDEKIISTNSVNELNTSNVPTPKKVSDADNCEIKEEYDVTPMDFDDGPIKFDELYDKQSILTDLINDSNSTTTQNSSSIMPTQEDIIKIKQEPKLVPKETNDIFIILDSDDEESNLTHSVKESNKTTTRNGSSVVSLDTNNSENIKIKKEPELVPSQFNNIPIKVESDDEECIIIQSAEDSNSTNTPDVNKLFSSRIPSTEEAENAEMDFEELGFTESELYQMPNKFILYAEIGKLAVSLCALEDTLPQDKKPKKRRDSANYEASNFIYSDSDGTDYSDSESENNDLEMELQEFRIEKSISESVQDNTILNSIESTNSTEASTPNPAVVINNNQQDKIGNVPILRHLLSTEASTSKMSEESNIMQIEDDIPEASNEISICTSMSSEASALTTNNINTSADNQRVEDSNLSVSKHNFEVKSAKVFYRLTPDGKYLCSYCGQIFPRLSNLREHSYRHLRITYPCTRCNISFISKLKMEEHYLSSHLVQDLPYKCTYCFYRCQDKANLEKHTEMHKKKLFSCKICTTKFAKESELNKHIEIHNNYPNIIKNICFICNNEFASADELKEHLLSVHKKLSYCNKCNKDFTTQAEFKIHKEVYHTMNISRTKIISPGLKMTLKLNQTKKFKCKLCNQESNDTASVQLHMKNIHKNNNYCLHCDKIFKSVNEISLHNATIHANFKCVVCDKDLENINALQMHILLHKGLKPLKCTQCVSVFTNKSNLIQHMFQAHKIGEIIYKCKDCAQFFKDKAKFLMHLKTHKPNNNNCPICKRVFRSKINFEYHMEKHKAEYLFKCESCDKSFIIYKTYCEHVEKLHSGKFKCAEHKDADVANCILCVKVFVKNDGAIKL